MFVSETAGRLLQSLAFNSFVVAAVGDHAGAVSATHSSVVRLVSVSGHRITSILGSFFEDL
jgi:hypothetical protein